MTKRYGPPATPCDRMIRHEAASAAAKMQITEHTVTLDPVALLHTIREDWSALTAIVSLEIRPTPRGDSLERFLARLPDRSGTQGEITAPLANPQERFRRGGQT